MVCHCLLIETDRDGLVLVDTALSRGDLAARARNYGLGASLFFGPRPGADAASAIEQVRGLGYRPEDVRHVVLTHLDIDHAGGLGDFPGAKVHVHEPEYAAAQARGWLVERLRYQAVRGAGGGSEILLVPLAGLEVFQRLMQWSGARRRENQERLRALVRDRGAEVRGETFRRRARSCPRDRGNRRGSPVAAGDRHDFAEAARQAGMNRAFLHELIERHGLDPFEFRREAFLRQRAIQGCGVCGRARAPRGRPASARHGPRGTPAAGP